MHTWTVLAVLAVFVYTGEAKRCYSCLQVGGLSDCHTVADCTSNDMKCYATHYLKEDDMQMYYDFSCRANTGCSVVSRRQSGRITIWQSCCDGEYCNKNFDEGGNLLPPENHDLHCYNCQGVADPLDCLTTTACDPGQACFTIEEIDSGGGQKFRMQCLAINTCLTFGHHLPFGKRTTMCRACCDARENCNNQFCSKKLGITGMQPLGSSVEAIHTTVAATTTTQTPTTTTTTPVTTTSIYDTYRAVVTPATLAGSAGGTASFECKLQPVFTNLGQVRMRWLFSGQSDPIYDEVVEPPELTLSIHTLEQSDVGTYTCEIIHTQHTWRASGSLTVS